MSDDFCATVRSLLAHLDAHPHLATNLNGINHTRGTLAVQPFPFDREDKLSVLAEWARSLTDCTVVEIKRVNEDGTVHLDLCGRLVDGTPLTVYCLPFELEVDLLAAQTRLEPGDSFPVDLLLRLTADKRTCVSPGDQEHDHAMCEDVVAEDAAEARVDCPMDDPDCEAGAQLDPETACHTACEAPASEAVRS